MHTTYNLQTLSLLSFPTQHISTAKFPFTSIKASLTYDQHVEEDEDRMRLAFNYSLTDQSR